MRRFLSLASVCFGLLCPCVLAGQGPGPAAKEKGPLKKAVDKAPEAPKNPLTIESLKLSPGAILVIVDDLKDVLSLVPKMVLIRPEKLLEMEDRIKALEKLLKQERRPVSVCKLHGRLDEDLLHLRGEFLFSTEQPKTTVYLGMQGAFMKEEGDLDRVISQLEAVDDGYVAKVEKPGNHQLNLNMVVPVGLKRAGIGSSSPERSLDLVLPGATVTTLSLELPAGVKEVRWNDIPEKRAGARWELALGRAKTLALTWKEPVTLPGTGPFLTVDAQITGKIEETQIIWNAELHLEDLRGQTKEWHFALPSGAKADVKTAGGMGYDLKAVEGKPYTHVLEVRDPGTERWVVQVQAFQTRPEPGVRLPVGPFQVLGAYRQQGLITIQAAPEAMRGQRVVFHRFGEIHYKETARVPTTLATFQYWSMPPLDKGGKGLMRTPLEMEWKFDRGKVEALVEHELNLQGPSGEKGLEITTRIQFKKRPIGLEGLDFQVPRLPLTARTGSFHESILPFPAGVPWFELMTDWGTGGYFQVEEYAVEGEGESFEWLAPDSTGRARIRFLRPAEDISSIVVRGRCVLPEESRHIRLELPRPLDVTELGTKAVVKGAEGVELLRGKPGQEKPVPDIHKFARVWEGAAEPFEFAWRTYRPAILASAIADVTVMDRSAHVVMTVHVNSNGKEEHGDDGFWDAIVHPKGIEKVSVKAAKGKKVNEVVYEYDLDLVPAAEPAGPEGKRQLRIAFPWPERVTHKEVKVRLWAPAGARVALSAEASSSRTWKDRESETIEEKKVLPSLVLFCSGEPEPELNLVLESSGKSLAPLLVNGALIRVRVDEEGNQFYRAHFLVQKVHARRLDVEMPLPPAACLENAWLDGIELPRESSAHLWNVIHLKVEPAQYVKPAVLEIEYKVPAGANEGRRSWRTMFLPPRLLGEVEVHPVQWQVKLPPSWFAIPFGSQVRQRYRWGLLGWLAAPLPVEGPGFEVAAGQPDPAHGFQGPTLCLEQSTLEPTLVLHFSRPVWLLTCSGGVLLLGLALLLISIPRAVLWLLTLVLVPGLFMLAWFWPMLLPAVVYGCQPGVVALVLLVLLQWLLNQHYQRQMVFLPGFTRMKMGSSLSRTAGLKKREPSTVDAPASSVSRKPSTNSGN